MKHLFLACVLLLLLAVPTFAQDVIFQDFYWDTVPPAGQTWWTHLESELPALSQAGIRAVWVPSPSKGGVGKYDMGYGPYDLYDLGSKDQKGTVATRFGTKDEFLRFVAAAHRLGIKVYAECVMNHASGADYAEPNPVMERLGWNDLPDQSKIPSVNRSPDAKPGDILRSWTGFAPKGADGKPGTGRFPRTWRDFHPNEAEPDRNPPYHVKEFGEDYAFQGDNEYVRKSFVAWSRWFVAQTGIDGYRLDNVKGMEPDWIAEFADATPNLWMVGEFLDGNAGKTMDYLKQANNSIHLFDYPLYFAVRDLTFRPEAFDMRDLLKRRLPNRDRAVTFAGNHDMSRDNAVIVYHPGLAYALTLAMSGTPMVYYSDFWRAGDSLRREITTLVQAHNALAQGAEIVRYADHSTLALERDGHLLAVFNSGGDGAAHTLTVQTNFGPQRRLTDYVGNGKPIITDAQGRATVTVAPYGYAYYGAKSKAKETPPIRPITTSQTWEFADDLDTGRLALSPKTVRVTLARGETLTATLALDGGAAGTLTVTDPAGKTVGQGTSEVTLPGVALPGAYQIQAINRSADKVHGTLTVVY